MNLQELWQQQPTDVSRASYPTRQATVADRVRRQMGPLERTYSRRQSLISMGIPIFFGGMYLLSLAVSDRLTWLNGLGMGLVILLAFTRGLSQYLTVRRWRDPASLPVVDYLRQSLHRIELLRRDVRRQRWMALLGALALVMMAWGTPPDDKPLDWTQLVGLGAFAAFCLMILLVLHRYFLRLELQRYANIETHIHQTLADWDQTDATPT